MKIAVVTEDGVKINSHFGMAPFYRVLTVDNGKIVADEMIAKPHKESHGHAGHHHDHDHHKDDEHGHGHHKGMKFFDPIKDCQILICGGMGEPPYKRASTFGFDVILTGGKIDATIEAYLKGELVSDQRRIHRH